MMASVATLSLILIGGSVYAETPVLPGLNADAFASIDHAAQSLDREMREEAHIPRPKLPKDHLTVPIMRQPNHYSCGATALSAVLHYWKSFKGPEEDLYPDLGTTKEQGTAPDKIAQVAGEMGLRARLKQKSDIADLRQALGQGETVVLDIQAWPSSDSPRLPWAQTWEEGHYVVLIGMDSHYIYLMDPSVAAGYTYIAIPEFLDRWHDYEGPDPETGEKNEHLAIFIRGEEHLPSVPGPLTPTQ